MKILPFCDTIDALIRLPNHYIFERTTIVMKRINQLISVSLAFIMIIISICIFPTSVMAKKNTKKWPSAPDIYAETGVLIEASTGSVLFDKKKDKQMYPASITKILTSLLAIENSSMDEIVTFSHDAVYSLEYGDANIARQEGEKLSMEDCLYALLLHSANEVANAIGEHISGSTKDFAKLMNERAKEAGAVNSHFENPSGLYYEDQNHYTTAYDMAMITRAVLQYPEFLRIEANTTYIIPKTNKHKETLPIVNRHKMLLPTDYRYYEGAQGGKTGYVDQSGNTLVTVAKRGDLQLICVVMKSNSENVYNDTKLLLDYGFDNFQALNISHNETRFNLNESGFFDSISYLFDTTGSVANINENDIVVIPQSSNFKELTYQLNWRESDNSTADINYFYGKTPVGKTTLTLSSASVPNSENIIKSLNTNDKQGFTFNTFKKILIIILKIIGIILAIIVLVVFILFIRSFIERRNPSARRRRNRRRRYRKKINSSTSSTHKRRTPRKPRY